MSNINKLVFFSVFNGSTDDLANHDDVLTRFKDLNPLEVNGCYKGVQEKSICLSFDHIELILNITRRYKQESILIVDHKFNSELKFLNNSPSIKGSMKWVDRKTALKCESWSHFNGSYLVSN